MTTLMEIDGRPAIKAESQVIGHTDEYRCPRCDSLLPAASMRRVDAGLGRPGFGLQVYCTHCDAGFGIDCGYQDGRIVQYGPATLLMGESIGSLRKHVGQIRGDIEAGGEDGQQAKPAERLRADLADVRRRLTRSRAHVYLLEAAEREIADKLSGQIRLEIDAGVYEGAGKVDAAVDRLAELVIEH